METVLGCGLVFWAVILSKRCVIAGQFENDNVLKRGSFQDLTTDMKGANIGGRVGWKLTGASFLYSSSLAWLRVFSRVITM
jgi:hypothetical protein